MKKSWKNYNTIPDDRKPLIYKIPDDERDFIKRVMTIFHKRKVLKKL